ncbi:MAG: CPBP family intramembrane metalloprotease [Clostridia bacterium]|nr:CPBP family intramembrane metalloprotease [Clostridia bacterium]
MREKISRIAVLVSVAAFGVLWYLDPVYSQDETVQFLWKSLVFRVLGSAVFLSLCVYFGYRICNRPPLSSWAIWLPCLAVVINNLPILALVNGTAWVERWELFPLFIADSLFIGIFEELAFRGTLFLAILEKRRDSTKRIFWTTVISSAVFGLVHFANLLEGAGVGATVMQVGYSFLIGGMCSIVLLKTGNIIFCILLHAIFDFCGNLVPMLGGGDLWDTPTIVITAVLAVIVTVWELFVLLRVKPEETDRFYPIKKDKEAETTVAEET